MKIDDILLSYISVNMWMIWQSGWQLICLCVLYVLVAVWCFGLSFLSSLCKIGKLMKLRLTLMTLRASELLWLLDLDVISESDLYQVVVVCLSVSLSLWVFLAVPSSPVHDKLIFIERGFIIVWCHAWFIALSRLDDEWWILGERRRSCCHLDAPKGSVYMYMSVFVVTRCSFNDWLAEISHRSFVSLARLVSI